MVSKRPRYQPRIDFGVASSAFSIAFVTPDKALLLLLPTERLPRWLVNQVSPSIILVEHLA